MKGNQVLSAGLSSHGTVLAVTSGCVVLEVFFNSLLHNFTRKWSDTNKPVISGILLLSFLKTRAIPACNQLKPLWNPKIAQQCKSQRTKEMLPLLWGSKAAGEWWCCHKYRDQTQRGDLDLGIAEHFLWLRWLNLYAPRPPAELFEACLVSFLRKRNPA